ncbi:MAG: hypothetical protein K6G56_03800 [Clostridiales bacterium]|nr:hypothetical protein [Clostridiales bacterium]
MNAFRAREGVELVEICGEYLLVATKDAREACPFATQINKAAADYWKLLDGPCTIQTLADKAVEKLGTDAKSSFLSALMFVSKMSKTGYIVMEDRG